MPTVFDAPTAPVAMPIAPMPIAPMPIAPMPSTAPGMPVAPIADTSAVGLYPVVTRPTHAEPPEPYAPPEPRELGAQPRSRKPLVLIGGAIAGVILVIAIVVGATHTSAGVAKPAVVAAKTDPDPVAKPVPPTPTPAPPPASAVVAPTEPDPTATTPAPVVPPKPAIRNVVRTTPGKKLVLDYDKGKVPVDAGPKSTDQSLAKARTAYAAGNQRLFAGDPTGAIRQYHQALAAYPGYVAGYRGLGLAYAQLGDKANAVSRFART